VKSFALALAIVTIDGDAEDNVPAARNKYSNKKSSCPNRWLLKYPIPIADNVGHLHPQSFAVAAAVVAAVAVAVASLMWLLRHCRRCQRLSNECTAEANGQRQHGWAPQLGLALGLGLGLAHWDWAWVSRR